MNKKRIDELLLQLAIDSKEYYILGGASLVLRGIKDECSDLDLCITKEALEALKNRFDIKHIDGKPNNLFQITEEIEAFVEPIENFKYEMVECYPLEDLELIIEFKKKRGSDKDKEAILKIEDYLKNLKFEISCGAYVIDNDKVLMVKHKNGGHWGFPKGHMEQGETKEQTAIREVLEETGIEIKIISDKQYKNSYKPKMNIQKEVIFFEALPIGGTLKNQESEVSDIEWVELDNVLEKLTYENSKKTFRKFIKAKKL